MFHYNAFVILSNGLDAGFDSITSGWDHFYRWKRLDEDDPDPAPKHDEPPLKPVLPILLQGMCGKTALLDIVENFTLFDSCEQQAVKVVARNHQYLGINRAVDWLKQGDASPSVLAGKLGVFWHTQGSGKSYSMVFFCQKVHRTVSAAYTFVLVTDRKELDDQIHGTFPFIDEESALADYAAAIAKIRAHLASVQAQLKMAIIDQLLAGMPDAYSNADIEARADGVFQYVQQQMQFWKVH